MTYEEFVTQKRLSAKPAGIVEPPKLNKHLFPFQADITRWALRAGRAALFEDCGLGKSIQALEWARVVAAYQDAPVLIMTPLAVAQQFVREGDKFGITVNHARSGGDVKAGINVTNYERLHMFDPRVFGGVVADESSCLKDYTSATRNALIEAFSQTPFRLACTATPAPNDHMELGNHAEFLGVMSRTEMLSMFFVHDGGSTQDWRLKGHARRDFWRWVCSWAVAVRKPSDLGYVDAGYVLPPLKVHEHVVSVGSEFARAQGSLFVVEARGLEEQRHARRSTISDRVKLAAEIVNGEPVEPWLIWGDLNDETTALAASIPGAVEVSGSDSADFKEQAVTDFCSGKIRVLISKASIFGFGVNLQHCARVAYVGLGNSFESWYQSIRRVYRFGQKRPIECHVITSEADGAVVANLKRKQGDAEKMIDGMLSEMSDFANVRATRRDFVDYQPIADLQLPPWIGTPNVPTKVIDQRAGDDWIAAHADCVDVIRALPESSIGYTVFSPPFASLYVYSASDRDMGNVKDGEEFAEHFKFLIPELLRVSKPGRLLSFHCMNLPTSKARDGYIGISDFRGELIRAFVEAGWIYHSEVCIWKDPVTAMQRTKALGLLHKQIKKDSCMSRQGIADYLVTMRKPGDNPERVTHTDETFPVELWQRYASPVWMDIDAGDTLQYMSAREHDDERHIAPLQLGVIRRGMELWTNPGDVVLSPFMGIGSEGYVARQMGRRFIGAELKESYWKQAVANLDAAGRQQDLIAR